MVFDRKGAAVAVAQKEHRQIYPKPGWVEHDPAEIVSRTREVVAEAMERRGLAPATWRPSASPTSAKPPWCGTARRASPSTTRWFGRIRAWRRWWRSWRAKAGRTVSARGPACRWPLISAPPRSAGFSTTWPERGGAPKRANSQFGNIDTYLAWHLTGGASGGIHITDVTNASRTQLMNLDTLDWDDEMLRAFAIPRAMLPEIRSSSEVYGPAAWDAVKGVPLAGILGDQQAALVGQACFEPGEAKNTYGTGCFLLMNTGRRPVASTCGLLTTVAYRLGGQPAHYALEGSVALAGALVQWLRDNLGLIASSDGIEALARTVEDNGGVYFVPAFSGLYAPYWKDSARGVIAGLTRYANKGHLARAVLEATAFQTREVLDAMERDSGIHLAAAARRWRHGGQRAADAVSGRHSEPPGGAARHARDHRPGRGVRGRAGGGLFRGSGRFARQLDGGLHLAPRHGRGAARPAVSSLEKGGAAEFRLGGR